MRIVEVRISNIGCIEELVINPQALTVITGANGVGKTAVLEAIRAAFVGGHDPTLIRIGAKKGEVEFTLDAGATIKRTITEKRSTLDVRDPDGNVVDNPATYVKQLASGFGFDPLSLMTASKKERGQFLLECMPITFPAAELNAATARAGDKFAVAEDADLNGLAVITKEIYSFRTETNRAGEQANSTAIKLRKDLLPEDDETDWSTAATDLQTKLDAAKNDRQELTSIADRMLAEELDSLATDERKEIDEIHARFNVARESARVQHADVLSGQLAARNESIEVLTGELATARERADGQKKSAATRELIESMRKQGGEYSRRAIGLTDALTALEELKTRKLAEQPIQGVELKDGDIFVDGVPFERLNTAKQFELCFQIAALKTGELGTMVCDRAESLDAAHWRGFMEVAQNAGYQIFAARVGAGPLGVYTS